MMANKTHNLVSSVRGRQVAQTGAESNMLRMVWSSARLHNVEKYNKQHQRPDLV